MNFKSQRYSTSRMSLLRYEVYKNSRHSVIVNVTKINGKCNRVSVRIELWAGGFYRRLKTDNFNFALWKPNWVCSLEVGAVTMAITRPFYSIVRVYGHSLLERLTKCFMFPSTFLRANWRPRERIVRCIERNDVRARPLDRDKKEVLSINRNTVAALVPSDNCAQ